MSHFTLAACLTLGAAMQGAAAQAAPPVVRIAELEIEPASLEAYKAILTEEIETSVRVEPGVLSLNAVSIDDNPAHIRLLEVYASQAAYEAHLKAPHFVKYKVSTAGMVRSLKLISTTPIMLCAKSPAAHCM
jgi:quinol monooxygenase YgiN